MLRKILLSITLLTLGLALACGIFDDRQTVPVEGNPENKPRGAGQAQDGLRCDAELRRFLTDASHSVVTADGANAAVSYVQSQHASRCSPSHWNPHVWAVAIDDAGNIDVSFALRAVAKGSNPVTTTGEGTLRWVFLVADDRWYATEPDHPAMLGEDRSKNAKPTAEVVATAATPEPEQTTATVTDRDVYEEAWATCNGYYRGIEVTRRKQVARLKSLEGLRDSLRRNCDGAVEAVAAALGVTPAPVPTWPPTAPPLPTWAAVPTATPWLMPTLWPPPMVSRPTKPSPPLVWSIPTPPNQVQHTPEPVPTRQRPVDSRSTQVTGSTLNVTDIEHWIVFFTNEERKQAGLPPFLYDTAISVIARRHSENMGRQDNMSHSLDGKDPTNRALDTGYDCRAYRPDGSYTYGLSENIAQQPQVTRSIRTGNGPWVPDVTLNDEQIAKALVQGWMDSPGHRRNILEPEARRIGAGVAITPGKRHGLPWGHVWATQNFSQCD